MAGRRKAPADGYRLTLDGLGFYRADGTRGEIEGKGRVFLEAELEPECLARGLETGALEPADADGAADLEPDEVAADADAADADAAAADADGG